MFRTMQDNGLSDATWQREVLRAFDTWTRETFYAPGAPRAAWLGLRYRF